MHERHHSPTTPETIGAEATAALTEAMTSNDREAERTAIEDKRKRIEKENERKKLEAEEDNKNQVEDEGKKKVDKRARKAAAQRK